MSAALKAVSDQLNAIGFRVRVGGWAPFGDELPLVTAVAWDECTAQLVLVAEETEECSDEDWRQLLFAAGALRHHLSEPGLAGFGAPVVLAIVSEEGQQQLRQLAEDLVRDYVLFARVD